MRSSIERLEAGHPVRCPPRRTPTLLTISHADTSTHNGREADARPDRLARERRDGRVELGCQLSVSVYLCGAVRPCAATYGNSVLCTGARSVAGPSSSAWLGRVTVTHIGHISERDGAGRLVHEHRAVKYRQEGAGHAG